MLRMNFAGIAVVAIGAIGGLALAPAKTPNKDPPALRTGTATLANPVVASSPKPAAARPDPEVEATPDKPEIRFDGDRVSVRFGKFKIEF